MYFTCPSCKSALRVDAAKIPEKLVKYSCKKCGTSSVVQEHLQDSLPSNTPTGRSAAGPSIPADEWRAERVASLPETADTDGTIYHQVSSIAGDFPPAGYDLQCAVKGLDGAVHQYVFQKTTVTIGRGDTDISVRDPLASRVHAELEKVKDTIIVKDLESTNGTFVNEERVTVRILQEGDVVRIGNTFVKAVARLRET